MSINECGSTDPHCGCVVVWEDGRRYVKQCGQLSSLEEYVFTNVEAIKQTLARIERNQGNLAP